MRKTYQKTTPKVKNGKTQRKNNSKQTPNYWNTPQKEVIIDRQSPGQGFKHFLKKKDIRQFIEIIPNWDVLSEDLHAIILSEGNDSYFGWCNHQGIIAITAWDREMDIEFHKDFVKEHEQLLNRLHIKRTPTDDDYLLLEFNEDQIKAFQLLHIFLHELGHHHDRIHTKNKKHIARGENYAENYAYEWEEKIWYDYEEVFGVIGA